MDIWLGLDIGGANLKASDGQGWSRSVAFPLWREPQRLADALVDLIAEAPPANGLAVTMTGELADCYETKADGVRSILDAVDRAAASVGPSAAVRVYSTHGTFLEAATARERPLAVAAANWHAIARFVGRHASSAPALLLDLGSTTCDIIPLIDGEPAARGRTDPERLLHGELVYTGVVRSPICALVERLPWRDGQCPVAQEPFATTRDAYLLLGDLPESPHDTNTADGRPATRQFARDRLARQICADRTMYTAEDAIAAAKVVKAAQLRLLEQGLRQVLTLIRGGCNRLVVSGEGEFLLRELAKLVPPDAEILSLAQRLGPQTSQVAAAHAVAVLAAEQLA
ncbi:MAG: hydantoinase/oxoprolinase family protein [Pirellulales bacterium]